MNKYTVLKNIIATLCISIPSYICSVVITFAISVGFGYKTLSFTQEYLILYTIAFLITLLFVTMINIKNIIINKNRIKKLFLFIFVPTLICSLLATSFLLHLSFI